jgi:hypothetical protein
MANLSPAAASIVQAFDDRYEINMFNVNWQEDCIAAALCAAADQAHPKAHIEDINYVHQNYVDGWKDALDVILAIADELKAL